MKKLLNEQYMHIGTDNIYKELWLNIQTDQIFPYYHKPYGGLWTSNINNNLCDWLSYLEVEKPSFYHTFINKDKCSFIKYKKNSKLLSILNENDFKNLKNSEYIIKLKKPIKIDKYYYSYLISFIPNYEKISEDYDLFYVDNNADNCFKSFSIKTMLTLNPNCIDYYNSIKIDLDKHVITDISENKIVKEPNNEYFILIDKIKKYFYDIEDNNYEEYIRKLNILKKEIEIIIKNEYKEKNINILNNSYKNKLLEVIVNNIYRDLYIEKQKKLIKKL